ncbi:MAG: hypothetical protein IJG36_05010 [Synergistaceae bacterium]|nr:hypothetical protein [Synergistaceae bacterium]
MHERIDTYIKAIKDNVQDTSGYELAARVCAKYFDERGITYPTAEDWTTFKEYYPPVYLAEKGKELSPTTLQQNYVARGKAFYRWCYEQDNPQAPAPAIPEEARQPALFEDDSEEARPQEAECHLARKSARAESETEKRHGDISEETDPSSTPNKPRINFLLNENLHSALMSLAYLKGQTMTAILTEAIKAYIQGYSEEIAVLQETRRKLRGK